MCNLFLFFVVCLVAPLTGPQGLRQLDRNIEEWMRRNFGVNMDFDVHAGMYVCMQRLRTYSRGRMRACMHMHIHMRTKDASVERRFCAGRYFFFSFFYLFFSILVDAFPFSF